MLCVCLIFALIHVIDIWNPFIKTTNETHSCRTTQFSYLPCMLKWSLSGFCMLAFIMPQGTSKGWLKKTLDVKHFQLYYTPRNEVRGGYIGFTLSVCLSVRLSVCLSICLSVCLSVTFRVRPVASTVQGGLFPYLVQMINCMRGCVTCDDHWPWHISSRSFGLDLENRVRSVASTVLDGFFLYFAQMITIIIGCVAWYIFFRIWKFKFLANFWNFSALTLKKKIYSSLWILSIFSTNDH